MSEAFQYDDLHGPPPPDGAAPELVVLDGDLVESPFLPPHIDSSKLLDHPPSDTPIEPLPVTRETRLRYAMSTIAEMGRLATVTVGVEIDDNDGGWHYKAVAVNPYGDLDKKTRREAEVKARDAFTNKHLLPYRKPKELSAAQEASVEALKRTNHPAVAFLQALATQNLVPIDIRNTLSADVVTVSLGWNAQRKIYDQFL